MSLPHAILGILAAGPRHGHAVARELAHLLDGIRPVNRGQVYATLGRLTRRRMISVAVRDENDARAGVVRPYVILPRGRDELRRWLDGASVEPPARCGFAERLLVLHALGDLDGLARLVAARRARLATLHGTLRRIHRGLRHDAASTHAHEAMLRLVATEVAWLARVERTLLPSAEPAPDARSAHGA